MAEQLVKVNVGILLPPVPTNLNQRGLIFDLGFTNLTPWTSANPVLPTFVASLQEVSDLFDDETPNETRNSLETFFANNNTNGISVINMGTYSVGTTFTSGYMIGGTFGFSTTPPLPSIFIDDGSFGIDIDGTAYEITDLDFTAAGTLPQFVGVIQEALEDALTGTTITLVNDNTAIQITSPTTGLTSSVSALYALGEGTDISGTSYLNAREDVATIFLGTTTGGGTVSRIKQYLQSSLYFENPYYVLRSFNSLYTDATFPDLVASYGGDNARLYFLMDASDGIGGAVHPLYHGDKSALITLTQPAAPVKIADIAMGVFMNQMPIPAVLGQFENKKIFGATNYTAGSTTPIKAANLIYANSIQGYPANSFLINVNTQSGIAFTTWYAIDAEAAYMELQMTGSLVENAQNTVNPYGYDADGLAVLNGVLTGACTQLFNSGYTPTNASNPNTPAVSYIPYGVYITANPNDYTQGIYNGFTVKLQYKTFFKYITIGANFQSAPVVNNQ